jgi:hypothetical protein
MKLALLEFDYHAEVLRNACLALADAPISVHVFTTEHIWRTVGLDQHAFANITVDCCAPRDVIPFLQGALHQINACDAILFNTAAARFSALRRLDFQRPVLVRVHNSQAFFGSLKDYQRPRSAFLLWKDFSHLVRKLIWERDHYQMKAFVGGVDGYVFPTERMRSHAIEAYRLDPKRCFYVPMVSLQPVPPEPTIPAANHPIELSVIGRIDPRNRDYDQLMQAAARVPSLAQAHGRRVVLNLLGAANTRFGRNVVRRVSSFQSDFFRVNAFAGFVPQDVFSRTVGRSHGLILPIRHQTRYTIYPEYYGDTKISGAIHDLVTFQKPALVDARVTFGPPFDALIRPYHGAEGLAEQMVHFDPPAFERSQLDPHFSRAAVVAAYQNVLSHRAQGGLQHQTPNEL